MPDHPPPLHRPTRRLTDGVVTLDALTRDDVLDIVFSIDDEILRWVPLPDPYGESDARTFVEGAAATADSGPELAFAIRSQGSLVGAIGVSHRRLCGHPEIAEIGYWVAPRARNRGVARRAVRLLAQHVFATSSVGRIELLVHPDNHASRRVAEAAGAVFDGVRAGALHPPAPDCTTDAAVYVLLPAGGPPAGGADPLAAATTRTRCSSGPGSR